MSKNKYKSVILFRVTLPTINQIERIELYEKQLPREYKCVILTDVKKKINSSVETYYVDRVLVIKKYPEVKRMGGEKCKNKPDSFYMWILHSEHYLLWDDIYHLNYKFLWVFDQDVVYTGNIRRFFKKYDKYNADLVTYRYAAYFSKVWSGCVTEEYRNSRSNKTFYGPTHIHRLSKMMRNALKKEFKLKRHSQVEQMVIETALYYNLSIKVMENKDYDKYGGFGRIIQSKRELYFLMNNKSTRNIIYHPVRF